MLIVNRGGHYDTAIQAGAASFRASEDVVSILLKHGADPSLQGGHHGSALEASRYSGNLAVERLLIENGALKTFNGKWKPRCWKRHSS